jgi:hypothetical protein
MRLQAYDNEVNNQADIARDRDYRHDAGGRPGCNVPGRRNAVLVLACHWIL